MSAGEEVVRTRRPVRTLVVAAAVLLAVVVPSASHPAHASPPAPQSVAAADAAPVDPIAVRADALVDAMTVRQQAAAVVMGHISTTDPAALRDYMAADGLGGFILMGANIGRDEASVRAVTAALTADPTLPPLIAIDQEGGIVSRLPWDSFAASTTLKSAPVADTDAAFAARAALVARAGANVNFGVVADVTSDSSSFIYGRALGTDPASAADRVAAAVAAEEPFVASTLKHFPGHGAAPGDSHQLIPTTDKARDAWEAGDAVPFQAGIDAGASLLMFGHLAYTAVDALPASLSPTWHAVARDMGFDGVAVTDDLGMLQSTGLPEYADPVANAVQAIAAGNDLVLVIAHATPATATAIIDGLVAAVDSGALDADRLRDAAEHVTALRVEIGASGGIWAPCPSCDPAG